jgi:hypothetical protein
MIYRLVCILIFTRNLIPNYKKLFTPYITPTDKIIETVQTQYINEYLNNIMEEDHEKLIMVTAVAYDACNKYSGQKITDTTPFFKNTMDDVETYVSKMFASKQNYDNSTYIETTNLMFDIVNFYKGNSLPNEETLLESYNFDKCMILNYNRDKCTIYY